MDGGFRTLAVGHESNRYSLQVKKQAPDYVQKVIVKPDASKKNGTVVGTLFKVDYFMRRKTSWHSTLA